MENQTTLIPAADATVVAVLTTATTISKEPNCRSLRQFRKAPKKWNCEEIIDKKRKILTKKNKSLKIKISLKKFGQKSSAICLKFVGNSDIPKIVELQKYKKVSFINKSNITLVFEC
jgi:hypothetical protein